MATTQQDGWASHLRAALDAAAFDDAEVAHRLRDRLGEEPVWLSAVLSGSSAETPSMAHYLMISAVTNITVPVLLGQVSPSQSARIALRAQQKGTASSRVEAAHSRGVDLLRLRRLIGAWTADETDQRHQRLEDLRKVLSYNAWKSKSGEESALQVRARVEKRGGASKSAPIEDLVAFIESVGIPVEFTLLLPNDVHGLTVHDGTLGRWEGVVLVNAADSWVRQRFTLAHELCHFLYQDTGTTFVNDDALWQSTTAEEQRAEAFARHFLAPVEALKLRWTAALRERGNAAAALCAVMLHFGISRDATVIALKDLPRHHEAELARDSGQSVKTMMANAGLAAQWQDASTDQHEPGASPWLSEVAFDLFADGKISAATVAQVLGRPLVEVSAELVDNGWVSAAAD